MKNATAQNDFGPNKRLWQRTNIKIIDKYIKSINQNG